jgi:TolA-binding protein
MTARKPTSIFLLALTLTSALALSGCNPFSSDNKQPPAAPTNVPSVSQAEDAVRNAEKKLATAIQEAQNARDKAERAKGEADKLEKRATINNVNVNDPTSQTAQARVLQKQAEDDAKKAADDADAAKRDAETAKATLDAARNNTKPPENIAPAKQSGGQSAAQGGGQGGEMDGLLGLLLPGIGGLVGLLVLVGLFWWTWATIKDGNDNLAKHLGRFATKEESSQAYQSTSKRLKELNGKLDALQESMFRLSQTMQAQTQAQQREGLTESHAPRPYPPYGTQTVESDPYASSAGYPAETINFPITANNFLMKFSGERQVVKHDPLKSMLVKDPDGRGAFVLVRDGSVPGGQLCIIPRTPRFAAAEDFYNHYEKFYDCVRPGAGEVWVNIPTVVTNVDGGWKLLEKGELEVKS